MRLRRHDTYHATTFRHYDAMFADMPPLLRHFRHADCRRHLA